MAKKKAKTKRPAAKAKAAARPAKKKVMAKPVRKVKAKSVKKAAPRKAAPPARKAAAAPAQKPQSKALAPGYQWINTYITVRDLAAAIRFYQDGLGFKLRGKPMEMDGKIVHAEMTHNGSVIMMGPENPERGGLAPTAPQCVNLYVYVENVDDQTSRAATAGGRVVAPPSDQFWGDRISVITDPEGYTWTLATHVKDVSFEDVHPPATM